MNSNTAKNTVNYAIVIALLQAARATMWDGVEPRSSHTEYVCVNVVNALKESTGSFAETPESAYIDGQIKTYMNGQYTFNSYYAEANGYDHAYDVPSATLQDGRYAMIDSIIAHATKLAILQATLTFLNGGAEYNNDNWRKSNFVCHALKYATAAVVKVTPHGGTMDYSDASRDTDYIELQAKVINRIGGFDCVERYLDEIGVVSNDVVFVQNYRRTLVLALIAEYEAEPVKAEV